MNREIRWLVPWVWRWIFRSAKSASVCHRRDKVPSWGNSVWVTLFLKRCLNGIVAQGKTEPVTPNFDHVVNLMLRGERRISAKRKRYPYYFNSNQRKHSEPEFRGLEPMKPRWKSAVQDPIVAVLITCDSRIRSGALG